MTAPRSPKLTGSRCMCCACGEYFNSLKAFDRHVMVIKGLSARLTICKTPASLLAWGWSKNADGFWITQGMAVRAQNRRSKKSSAPVAPPVA